MGFYGIDPLYWMLLAPAIILALVAQVRVQTAFSTYRKVASGKGYSGAEAAAQILKDSGLQDVKIELTRGWLSDHYDPRTKTLRLSEEVFSTRSVSAVGIAAHEAGHAMQHASRYGSYEPENRGSSDGQRGLMACLADNIHRIYNERPRANKNRNCSICGSGGVPVDNASCRVQRIFSREKSAGGIRHYSNR